MGNEDTQLKIQIKLEPLNHKAEQKLLSDGFYYKVLEISTKKKVTRLKNIGGYHLLLKSLSRPVTRWVAMEGDPDYVVNESGA